MTKKEKQCNPSESDLVVVLVSLTSFSQREHRAAGAAAHPLAGAPENQADLDRTARHGRATFLEDQQQGQRSMSWRMQSCGRDLNILIYAC